MKNILKYFLAFVFLFSAFMKLIDFRNTVYFYSTVIGLPIGAIKILLALLIMLELIFAGFISFDFILNKTIYYLIFFSLLFFTVTSIAFMIFGIDNCGCFGTIIIDKPVISIIKNVLLFTILFILRKKTINKQYA
ncbi:MAG: MauE/DoxX family redox-associated membrane protein [Ignavibacteriaceae bacterium]